MAVKVGKRLSWEPEYLMNRLLVVSFCVLALRSSSRGLPRKEIDEKSQAALVAACYFFVIHHHYKKKL